MDISPSHAEQHHHHVNEHVHFDEHAIAIQDEERGTR